VSYADFVENIGASTSEADRLLSEVLSIHTTFPSAVITVLVIGFQINYVRDLSF
jgi:hypothetical protein